jgi:hypothetical protein
MFNVQLAAGMLGPARRVRNHARRATRELRLNPYSTTKGLRVRTLQATDPATTALIVDGARELYPSARIIVRKGGCSPSRPLRMECHDGAPLPPD